MVVGGSHWHVRGVRHEVSLVSHWYSVWLVRLLLLLLVPSTPTKLCVDTHFRPTACKRRLCVICFLRFKVWEYGLVDMVMLPWACIYGPISVKIAWISISPEIYPQNLYASYAKAALWLQLGLRIAIQYQSQEIEFKQMQPLLSGHNRVCIRSPGI